MSLLRLKNVQVTHKGWGDNRSLILTAHVDVDGDSLGIATGDTAEELAETAGKLAGENGWTFAGSWVDDGANGSAIAVDPIPTGVAGDNEGIIWYGRALHTILTSQDVASVLNQFAADGKAKGVQPELSATHQDYMGMGWFRVQVGHDDEGDDVVLFYTSRKEWVSAYYNRDLNRWEDLYKPSKRFSPTPAPLLLEDYFKQNGLPGA